MERDDVFADDSDERSPLALDQETLLNDQFRVGRVLGVGGFGITYLAFDEVLEMVVAVKEYLPNDIAVRKSDGNTVQPYTSTGENRDFQFGLKRFLQEARTLAKFESHPNIVRVRTFFQENGTGYLVMNFYEGRTLAEYLETRNGFLPETEALLVMEQVTEGLSAVHDQDVLHRDVDPNNVYLADNGTVVLLDFGAARTAVGERTHSMSVVLKRGYAPHEQYHSHGDQGPWTDVYACAATLYRTITGYKPPEAAARILDDDLVAPKELVPSLSEATNEAILKGLSVRPDDRPSSMAEFRDMLQHPPPDAEPGWIGEVTTMEASTETDGASGELEITVSHPCRLYVDGNETAKLNPNEPYTIGVETGSHRLRAVRTDQAESGSATVTASGTSVEEDGSDPRMTLDALVWQEVVSVSSEAPVILNVDFEAVADAEAASQEGEADTMVPEATEGTPADEGGDTIAADGSPAGPKEPISGGGDTVRAGDGADTLADPDVENEPPTMGQAEDAKREPLNQALPDRLVQAASETASAVEERLPSAQRVRAAGRLIGATGRDLSARVLRWGAVALAWISEVGPLKRFPLRYVYSGIGVVGLVLLLGLGWWMSAEESAPSTADSVPEPMAATVTNDETVFDVAAHHREHDTAEVQIAGIGTVPDSVATVAVEDSARIRVTPASGFAGTARIPYEIVKAGTDSVQSEVRLRVPFAGTRQPISEEIRRPQAVRADSLGGDGSIDVVVAALDGQSVTWNENQFASTRGFGATRPIETEADGIVDVTTADLSGNGRPDVVATSLKDDLVAWYENQSDSTFGERRSIDANADGAGTVETMDVDGDGDADVVAGTVLAETVVWYENEGNGAFGNGTTIADEIGGLETLQVEDLNENGRPEVLAVSYQETAIHRYEPTDSTADSLQMVKRASIGEELDQPIEVHAADVVGDERKDLLVGTVGTNSLLLFENRTGQDGGPAFGKKQVLASNLRTVESIDTGDLDNDGNLDIVAAAFESDTVAWLQQKDDGSFQAPEPVAKGVAEVISIVVTDVNGDGAPDIVAASQTNNTVEWYENALSTP